MNRSSNSPVLVLGRALHAPWNEGNRVIGRNTALSAATLRPVETISLSRSAFREQDAGGFGIQQIYTDDDEGVLGDYRALPRLLGRAAALHRERHFGTAHLFGLPLAVTAWLKQRRMRTVVHITLTRQVYQGRVEQLRAAAAWQVFDRWIDAYACSSEQIRASLLEQGYNRAKLHVVPPPIDTAGFTPAARDEVRHAQGWAPDEFVLVYVGTVSPLRFPAAKVLAALHAAAGSIPKLRLEVFAPVKTHAYNITWADENVRQAAADARVPVQIHLQDLAEAEKTDVFSAADAVLLPFEAPVAVEPPLTMLEAMACRTPVLVTPHANRSQIVRDWSNGITYSTPDELSERLAALYRLPSEQRAELCSNARRDILNNYSFAAAARALEAVWSTIEAELQRTPRVSNKAGTRT